MILLRMARPAGNASSARAARIAVVAFGFYIAATSVVGIGLGVHAGEGWLAIIYGCLGVTVGAAGVAAVWLNGTARGALLGWFFVGLASRAVVEGIYISGIGLPVAAAFLAALVFALSRRPSVAANLGAVAGGCLSVIAIVALAVAAPSLPLICQPLPKTGNAGLLLLYPSASPVFDATQRIYLEHCLAKQML